VSILEFLSYILLFYHTHRDIDNITPEASSQDGLIAGGCIASDCLLVDVVAPIKGATQLLRTLRAAAQAEQAARDCKPRYPVYVGISTLISGLTAQVFASWYILEAIESPGRSIQLSASFVGLIIILMVISSVDQITAALRSHKEGLAWVTEFAFGLCIRIALFVFPLTVLIGWMLDIPGMSMIFDGFQVTMLALTILLVNYVIQNGFLHW
jgi:calcium/proton exchanger cax